MCAGHICSPNTRHRAHLSQQTLSLTQHKTQEWLTAIPSRLWRPITVTVQQPVFFLVLKTHPKTGWCTVNVMDLRWTTHHDVCKKPITVRGGWVGEKELCCGKVPKLRELNCPVCQHSTKSKKCAVAKLSKWSACSQKAKDLCTPKGILERGACLWEGSHVQSCGCANNCNTPMCKALSAQTAASIYLFLNMQILHTWAQRWSRLPSSLVAVYLNSL